MAKEFSNELSGMLKKNPRKTSDKHPDYTGFCEINGEKYDIGAWIKTAGQTSSMAGQKYMSLKFTPESERQQAQPAQGGKPAQEDVPF